MREKTSSKPKPETAWDQGEDLERGQRSPFPRTRAKLPLISLVVALVCIFVYIVALSFAAIRIFINIDERRQSAEQEFYDLADISSSAAGIQGFMSDTYKDSIQDAVRGSQTIEGVIISGANNESAFEKNLGSSVNWVGNSPRFRQSFGLSSEPFYMPLRIEGQRNVSIRAVYSYLDRDFINAVLKITLLAVLGALALAFFTLIIETLGKKNAPQGADGGEEVYKAGDYYEDTGETGGMSEEDDESDGKEENFNAVFGPDNFSGEEKPEPVRAKSPSPARPEQPREKKTAPMPETALPEAPLEDQNREEKPPQGLFSPESDVGWEAYTAERLDAELHRSASFEQDLAIVAVEFKREVRRGDYLYRQFAAEVVRFFTHRDLIFERSSAGFTIIIPNCDLEQGFVKSEQFHDRILQALPLKNRNELCMGLSSRAGRLLDAQRILIEAGEALKKAREDDESPIIAFKSDPEKYRAYIQRNRIGNLE
jgi:hypothetical protein